MFCYALAECVRGPSSVCETATASRRTSTSKNTNHMAPRPHYFRPIFQAHTHTFPHEYTPSHGVCTQNEHGVVAAFVPVSSSSTGHHASPVHPSSNHPCRPESDNVIQGRPAFASREILLSKLLMMLCLSALPSLL